MSWMFGVHRGSRSPSRCCVWHCRKSVARPAHTPAVSAYPDRQRLYQGAHPWKSTAIACAKDLAKGRVVVVAGFQGKMNREYYHVGRGGSDTTGVALAAALKADECQIYTDVDGVYTTDPRVQEARRLDQDHF